MESHFDPIELAAAKLCLGIADGEMSDPHSQSELIALAWRRYPLQMAKKLGKKNHFTPLVELATAINAFRTDIMTQKEPKSFPWVQNSLSSTMTTLFRKVLFHPIYIILLLHPYSPNTRATADIYARLSTIPRDPSVEWMPVEPAKFLLLAVVEKLTGAVSYP
jgi:hypothetical protein